MIWTLMLPKRLTDDRTVITSSKQASKSVVGGMGSKTISQKWPSYWESVGQLVTDYASID